jgi:hypothetical protein
MVIIIVVDVFIVVHVVDGLSTTTYRTPSAYRLVAVVVHLVGPETQIIHGPTEH